jgi:hypothetical protein
MLIVLKGGEGNGMAEGDQCVVLEHIFFEHTALFTFRFVRHSSENSFKWDSHFKFKFKLRFLINVKTPLRVLNLQLYLHLENGRLMLCHGRSDVIDKCNLDV